MKYCGIGGQAVLEGIMMRNRNRYAVAVRKSDGTIETTVEELHPFSEKHRWAAFPFIRGFVSLIESLKTGMKTLMWSASFEEDENGDPVEMKKSDEVWTVVLAVVMALAIFVVLPTVLVNLLKRWIGSSVLMALIEGILRLCMFIGYIAAVSRVPDIKRTFMYHGSEHKCINCIESGKELTVENVMASSKEHRRCGTSFILIVVLISIVVFMIIRVDNIFLRIAVRILMIPVIAGLSYEILRYTGNSNSRFAYLISRPGMWMQGLTTKEPTEDMVEVAITAVEKVFDWRAFQKESFSN
ncbi:MAG: DUF1385 domain-containing protein [Lachnospiraceae bacterium]|nr:DUF1385 domain-containing protein [Lachnospiraceae bacterium]